MKGKIFQQRTYLNLISAIILVVGLGGAALIYQRAVNLTYGAWGYGDVDGKIYPIMPGDSKMYRHNLEVYGGKLNIMMDDFSRWFAGLWQGKSLAFIVGGTAILISFGLFYRANYLIPRLKSKATSEDQQDETG
ncbi:MAG: hypothetical protein NTY36_10005 [Deltaproteobacteria bacterium]|nr:hypothetical protein [Deltaproteobacteria bacterium]